MLDTDSHRHGPATDLESEALDAYSAAVVGAVETVAPGDHRRHAAAVDEADARARHALHDVLVGEQVAVRGDYHAGAGAAAGALGLGRATDVHADDGGRDRLDRAHHGRGIGVERLGLEVRGGLAARVSVEHSRRHGDRHGQTQGVYRGHICENRPR